MATLFETLRFDRKSLFTTFSKEVKENKYAPIPYDVWKPLVQNKDPIILISRTTDIKTTYHISPSWIFDYQDRSLGTFLYDHQRDFSKWIDNYPNQPIIFCNGIIYDYIAPDKPNTRMET